MVDTEFMSFAGRRAKLEGADLHTQSTRPPPLRYPNLSRCARVKANVQKASSSVYLCVFFFSPTTANDYSLRKGFLIAVLACVTAIFHTYRCSSRSQK